MAQQKDVPGIRGYMPGFWRQLRRLARRHPGRATGRRAAESAVSSPPPGKTILIVELDGRMCCPLAQQLEHSGFGTQVASGQAAALDILAREASALVIVVGSAGLDLYRALRRATPVPILALDPRADDEQVLSAFAAGVDQFQARPISCNEVVARILALLRRAM